MRSEDSITQLLSAWEQRDHDAIEKVTCRVKHELHTIARAYLSRRRPN